MQEQENNRQLDRDVVISRKKQELFLALTLPQLFCALLLDELTPQTFEVRLHIAQVLVLIPRGPAV